jgi:hypothetical protein
MKRAVLAKYDDELEGPKETVRLSMDKTQRALIMRLFLIT